MSDLSAGQCGCNECTQSKGNNNCMWLILILLFCGGCGNGSSMFSGRNGGFGCGCSSCEWIIILLLLTGGFNGSSAGDGCGCGCGCGF